MTTRLQPWQAKENHLRHAFGLPLISTPVAHHETTNLGATHATGSMVESATGVVQSSGMLTVNRPRSNGAVAPNARARWPRKPAAIKKMKACSTKMEEQS
jgi:hypothetical protein